MLLVDIPYYLYSGETNIVKYRNTDDEDWYYMYMDIETINLLLQNYGIISTVQVPGIYRCCDNPTTGKIVNLNYCGAKIILECRNNTKFDLNHLEQNY